MHFSRLRLSGFKSFVDATEFHIEPGLTGVVGPNGCGKSNLLEALRWVMGANSAKAMRGDGMDDVIFSGSSARPGRNHAEVKLTVDNADGTAPARFATDPVIEVTRRIDRGAGSTYRINGVEVRARDVQLLFADASTGANSPALVRQGQISELIAAKPQNRRRILEEAAGVSGLHSRRHEAQLRVNGAEVNLVRLDDLSRQLESGLGRLRREARTAARYKKLAAQIRALHGAVLHARWTEAVAGLALARDEAGHRRLAVEVAARAAVVAATEAVEAQAALPALRDEETAAAAIAHHLEIEKDRLDRALEEARAEVTRLTDDRRRIGDDLHRGGQAAADATDQLVRLGADLAQVERDVAAAPERSPALESAAHEAEKARAAADAALEAAAARVAAGQADARAARARLADAQVHLTRVSQSLAQARSERRALGEIVSPELHAAVQALAAATGSLGAARGELEAAERRRADVAGTESTTRQTARATEDALARKSTEARGLARLVTSIVAGPYPVALDAVTPDSGLEAALAAALGDDLTAALDARALSFWNGRDASPPDWPQGVTPLAAAVTAPRQLDARLAHVGLVSQIDGPRLQSSLPPGCRIVSREGDLWRWDGYTVKADAPRPSQVRLEQKSRLAALEIEVTRLGPAAARAKAAHDEAVAGLATAEGDLRPARERPRALEAVLARARETVERLQRESTRREARGHALDETVARLDSETSEVSTAVETAATLVAALPSSDADATGLARHRAAAAAARDASAGARAAFDRESAVRGGRMRRLESLRRDHGEWTRRGETARRRQGQLETEREKTVGALANAARAPETVAARRLVLIDELDSATRRRSRASDALAAAETRRSQADRVTRAADAAAADTREALAGAEARLEGAIERLNAQTRGMRDATGLDPEELGRRLTQDALGLPVDAGGAETLLAALERERDSLGGVNLLAEAEMAEVTARLGTMAAERADLAGALSRLKQAIEELNAEGRERLTAAFEIIDRHFRDLFTTLFQGGAAELRLVESDDPLEAGLEILACPPGKRMAVMSLMSGGEQALTAVALIFAVFLANPAPICVLDEVDAPLDDANVARFCDLLGEMRRRAPTRFLTITHNPLTMSRMDRLYGVTMRERGVSQLVSVDLREAEALAAR